MQSSTRVAAAWENPAAAPGPNANPAPPPPDNQASSSRTHQPPGTVVNTPEGRTAARERAHAAVVLAPHGNSAVVIKRSGVFAYTATEKDCIDDAECTICLEDFEVGQEMGRLECFCRFHMKCIRDWFETKPGQCPIHQHTS